MVNWFWAGSTNLLHLSSSLELNPVLSGAARSEHRSNSSSFRAHTKTLTSGWMKGLLALKKPFFIFYTSSYFSFGFEGVVCLITLA